MTVVQAPRRGARGASRRAGVRSASRRAAMRIVLAPPKPPRRLGLPRLILSAAFLTLGVTLLGFAAWFMAGSQLHYDRVQYDAYASFRPLLEQGAAPTGPTNPNNPKQLLAPGTPVAVLTIPEIRLNVVVLEGTSGDVLEGGPGHLRDTPLPGQIGVSEIMGRRAAYGGPFALVPHLSPGAMFTVTTGQGVARYKVLDVRTAGDKIPPIGAGQGRLILATADGPPFAPTGVVRVDAQLMSRPQPAPPMVVSTADIGPGEEALGTDPIAWIPLVLWGQALVLAAIAVSWARSQWNRWQAWIVAVPVLGFLGLEVADQVARLLPNLT